MFGFLKAYFTRRRAFEAEVAKRERARVAMLTKEHGEGAKAYIAEHLSLYVVEEVAPSKKANSPGHLREGTPPCRSDRRASSNRVGEGEKNCDVRYSVRSLVAESAGFDADTRFPIAREPSFENHLECEYLKRALLKPKKTFVGQLYELLRERPYTHAQIYKAAQIDRRLFSKIISDVKYQPSRDVAIALCFALNLSLEQAKDLLKRAGYALSQSLQRDLVFEYCFTNKVYDILVVNGILHDFGEKLL